MAEENNAGGNGGVEKNNIPEAPKDIVLIIKLSPQGQLAVQAPGNGQFYDIPMSLYLMEMAKDHIKAINKVQSQSRIIQSRPRISDIFKKR